MDRLLAEALGGYTQRCRYRDLSPAVVHEVKRRVIDALGCAWGAYGGAPCRMARDCARPVTAVRGARVWGDRRRTTMELATFANGVMVRYLDYNDTYLSQEPCHPSDLIPGALAVGEGMHADGKTLILAIALGYEVLCRLCDAASLRQRGWDHVTYGGMASALVTAKLLGLSPERTAHAVALAVVPNNALRQTRVGELSAWKGCAFANAARNGVFAARLASAGMTGPLDVFEGRCGFWRLVSGPFRLTLGGRHLAAILNTHIKYFPVEYHAQSAVEAALALRQRLPPGDPILFVRVETFQAAADIIGGEPEKWAPRSRETADHSLPYCVAVALTDGRVGKAQFTEQRIRDPRLRRLLKKVRIVETPRQTRQYPQAIPNRVQITTRSGRRWTHEVVYPRGHACNPMSDAEVEAKFERLSAPMLSQRQRRRLLARLWRLEHVSDVRSLLNECVLPRKR